MVEGEKGSRQANGSSEAVSRQRRPVPDAGEGEEMPPGDLARLLAAVGVLLGSHAAADLVVMPREELERREFAAYGHGWRDAAAQYHQLAEWVDGLPVTDADNRTPGQAAVIPFRRRVTSGARDEARRDEARRDGSELAGTGPAKALIRSPRPATGAADPAAREAADPTRPSPDPAAGPAGATPMAPRPAASAPAAPRPTRPVVKHPAPPSPPALPARAGTGAAEPGSASADAARADGVRPRPAALSRPAGPPSTSSPSTSSPSSSPSSSSPSSSSPPAFASKSRRSKVPTIPRLPRPRRQDSPDEQH